MKTLLFSFLVIITTTTTAQPTGYLISIRNPTPKIYKVTTTTQADSLTGFNTAALLINSRYVEILTETRKIYCEKRRIVIKKSGKIKFKKLKRNHTH